MASFKLKHLCFAIAAFCIAISCCKAQGGGGGGGGGGGAGAGAGGAAPGTQDAIQIVAQAALCFDNRPVINGCLQAMGINVGGNTSTSPTGNSTEGAPAPAPAPGNATANMCSGPCFGQMMLMMNCINGIMSNFQGYSPGLMQGVQAIFQMACSGSNNTNSQSGANATDPNKGSHMANINDLGNMASNGNGLLMMITLRSSCSCMFIIWTCIWLLLF